LLHALRSALAFEQALAGPHLSLDPPTPPALERRSREASAAAPSPKPAAPTSDASHAAPSTADAQTDSVAPMANMDLFGNEIDPRDDPSRSPWERIAALIPDDSPLRAMETLEEVERYVNDTILVPIDEARQNAVLGVGDPNADLVIIGEAPGADEDRTGEPFTGRAGQLLNKILAAINFKREEVYITNILKSRPPNNRDPLPAEVEAHIPILYRQLTLIKPAIILCVGKTAGNTLLDRRSSLGALRDKIHDFYGVPLIVTYHPAALLRNPQWKRPTWEDVKLLRTTYDKLVKA
jgi:uracil-DNA glycosylase family 4